jgi:hypothetical protein
MGHDYGVCWFEQNADGGWTQRVIDNTWSQAHASVLVDLNGDGETDFYECFNNDHQVTEHFHEFAMGLQVDFAGNFYYAKSARHALPAVVPHHGTLLRVMQGGGKTEILATGFRAANGVCLNDDGTYFVTDQEGHWTPKNRINFVKDGGFYGNMFGYHDVKDSSDAAMEQPICWITNEFDRSPAELLWAPRDAWGPLGGSLLNLSYGYGKLYDNVLIRIKGTTSRYLFKRSHRVDFNPGPGGFALNGEGDDVWLFSADPGGQLTGYSHGFHFGASDEGVSFGRYVNSQGSEGFVAQISNSFTNSNTGPLVGPLVISEIMYRPPQTGGNTNDFLQYIELQNISGAPVALFSPSLPLKTWHLRDAVDFDFPPGAILEAGGRILVIGFDPATDVAGLGAFRTAYPLATNVPLFGPWGGRLSDTDERIELRKPGRLTASGDVPSVLVEAVHYQSAAPWPEAAAGHGSALQRAVLPAYGNDPTNWFASGFSPGAINYSNRPPLVTITAPTDGATFFYPDGAWIRTIPTDTDGSVIRIEFYADGTKLGELTNAPFNLLWTNPPIGVHSITAAAWDNSGNVGLSAQPVISVTTPSLSMHLSPTGLDLAWPSNSGNYAVHMATNLVPPVAWIPLTNTPALLQEYWRVELSPLTNDASFYRLEAH